MGISVNGKRVMGLVRVALCVPWLLAGCRTTVPTVAVAPVWPAPPAAPRVVFCQAAGEPADLGAKTSLLRKIGEVVFGRSRSRFFVKPAAVCFDAEGNLLMTDAGAGIVGCFEAATRKWYRWDHAGKVRFGMPVAVTRYSNDVFVADSLLGKVIEFDLSGKMVREFTEGIRRPVALACSGDRLYVADTLQHCIHVFSLTGSKMRSIGARGTGNGQFNFPTHLASDARGLLYVTDSMNSRIQVMDGEGRFIRTIGSLGDKSGHFSRPKGVAVDGYGHVYVVDALFDNVQIFDPEGRFLLDFGRSGSGAGEFCLPSGIAIAPDNRVVVADSYNRRLQVFRYVGEEP